MFDYVGILCIKLLHIHNYFRVAVNVFWNYTKIKSLLFSDQILFFVFVFFFVFFFVLLLFCFSLRARSIFLVSEII